MPTTSLPRAFPNPYTKNSSRASRKPYAIMRSEIGLIVFYKDSNGDESSSYTQEIRNLQCLRLLQKTKQVKKITGLDKNQ